MLAIPTFVQVMEFVEILTIVIASMDMMVSNVRTL
jgi:hypothetical protein